MIYLDYAATSPVRREVLEEMLPYFSEQFGNPDSLHAVGRRAALALRTARDRIAAVLGVKSSEVYFTSGGTEADNWAVLGIARERGGRVLLSPIEHDAMLAPVARGREHVFCRVGADGERRCPNISHLTFEHGGTAFTDILDLAGVACSRGAACSSHSAKPSHVLMAMGRSAEESLRGVRFSFGIQTSEKDAADAAQIVIESYRKFKGGIS